MPKRTWGSRAGLLVLRWQGVLLSLIGLSATLWLATTGRLGLYIHPRYFIFTTALAVVAAALIVAAVIVGSAGTEDEHDHGTHEPEPTGAADTVHTGARDAWRRLRAASAVWSSAAIIAAAMIAFLVLPPATLTTATASARAMNTGAIMNLDAPSTADTSQYTVKDWAAALSHGETIESLSGQEALLSGFVTPDVDDPENVFYVARFVVTCCAVDAQPVGVPIYRPGWMSEFTVDSWIEVEGGFTTNPSVTSSEAIVLDPQVITAIEEPSMPYVY